MQHLSCRATPHEFSHSSSSPYFRHFQGELGPATGPRNRRCQCMPRRSPPLSRAAKATLPQGCMQTWAIFALFTARLHCQLLEISEVTLSLSRDRFETLGLRRWPLGLLLFCSLRLHIHAKVAISEKTSHLQLAPGLGYSTGLASSMSKILHWAMKPLPAAPISVVEETGQAEISDIPKLPPDDLLFVCKAEWAKSRLTRSSTESQVECTGNQRERQPSIP